MSEKKNPINYILTHDSWNLLAALSDMSAYDFEQLIAQVEQDESLLEFASREDLTKLRDRIITLGQLVYPELFKRIQ